MKLSLQQLEAHLWGAANILRGKTAGQDYKNYMCAHQTQLQVDLSSIVEGAVEGGRLTTACS